MIYVTGIDPGVVHTGVVQLMLDPAFKQWQVQSCVIAGLDCDAVVEWFDTKWSFATFIEGYRQRSHFTVDADMTRAINELKRRIPNATVLDNMGVKKVVKQELMELLGLWKFSSTTHHQDLRSAARIGLYGLMKNADWNPILAGFVMDQLDGRNWTKI